MPKPPPSECANCGAAIPRGAKACPECGADERTGWRDTDAYDGLDLPDSAYETESEESPRQSNRVNGIAWYWWLIAVIIVVVFLKSFVL